MEMESSSSSSSSHFSSLNLPPRKNQRTIYSDRFIPLRSAMDFDMAHYLLSYAGKGKENFVVTSLPNNDYTAHLTRALMPNGTRILAFKSKPQNTIFEDIQDVLLDYQDNMCTSCRHIPQSPDRTLDAPELLNDYSLNLLDWSRSNILALALRNEVFLWNASNEHSYELLHVDEQTGPLTSLSWSPDGQHIAVGMNNSTIQLWDVNVNRKIKILKHGQCGRVSALSWNRQLLTTGGKDGMIISNDVRIRSPVILRYEGHNMEVCGLKWSGSGDQLASGGDDGLLNIWEKKMASSNSSNQWLHSFENHMGAVKSVSWCPFESNLLASGDGEVSGSIKFWNTSSGTCLKSIDTGSLVSSLLWSKSARELLSSHGLMTNQLILWKYPTMTKIAVSNSDMGGILSMAQSPGGCTVAAATEKEALTLWNIFGTPKTLKLPNKMINTGPFQNFTQIR